MNVYDFTVKAQDGSDVSLADYKGKVLLIVNTATGCGFTPQYTELQELYKEHKDDGLEILDFPCNQFANQAPESDDEIHEFCTLKFGTEFPQFAKIDVNGENALPLFTWLKSQKGFEGFGKGPVALMMSQMLKKIPADNPDIRWNFTKFVVDREGNVVARFEPTADMKKVEECVAALL